MAMVEDVMAMIDDLGPNEREKLTKFISMTAMGSMALAVKVGTGPDKLEKFLDTMFKTSLGTVPYNTFKLLEADRIAKEKSDD